jgi:hypothetical protein
LLRIKNPRDFGAAAVFVLIGAAGVYFGRDLVAGTAAKMGPGYFPTILSWLIVALGAVIGVRSLAIRGPSIEPIQLRPTVLVIASVLAFAYLIDSVGLALTAIILTFVAAFARRQVKFIETLLLGVGLAVFSVLVFVYGLSQPLPAWWGGQ